MVLLPLYSCGNGPTTCELPRQVGTGFLGFHKKILPAETKYCQGSESMMGVRCRKNNSTGVFFRSMALEKMSNRSKIGSLEASRRLLEVRPVNIDGPKGIKNGQNQSKTKGASFLIVYKLDLFL